MPYLSRRNRKHGKHRRTRKGGMRSGRVKSGVTDEQHKIVLMLSRNYDWQSLWEGAVFVTQNPVKTNLTKVQLATLIAINANDGAQAVMEELDTRQGEYDEAADAAAAADQESVDALQMAMDSYHENRQAEARDKAASIAAMVERYNDSPDVVHTPQDVVHLETRSLENRLARQLAKAEADNDVILLGDSDDELNVSPVSLSSSPSQQSSPDVEIPGIFNGKNQRIRRWADEVHAEAAAARDAANAEAAAARARRFKNVARGTSKAARTGANVLGSVAAWVAENGPSIAVSGVTKVYRGLQNAHAAKKLAAEEAAVKSLEHADALAAIEEKRLLALERLKWRQQQARQQQLQKQRLLQQSRQQVEYPHPPNNGHSSSNLSVAELEQARIDELMTGRAPSPEFLQPHRQFPLNQGNSYLPPSALAPHSALAPFKSHVNPYGNIPITIAQPVRRPQVATVITNKKHNYLHKDAQNLDQEQRNNDALQEALRQSLITSTEAAKASQDSPNTRKALELSMMEQEKTSSAAMRNAMEESKMKAVIEQSMRQVELDKERRAIEAAVLETGDKEAARIGEQLSEQLALARVMQESAILEERRRERHEMAASSSVDEDYETPTGTPTGFTSASGSPTGSATTDDGEEILLTRPVGGKKKRRATRKYKKVKFIKKKRKHTHKRKLPKKSRKRKRRKNKKTLKH